MEGACGAAGLTELEGRGRREKRYGLAARRAASDGAEAAAAESKGLGRPSPIDEEELVEDDEDSSSTPSSKRCKRRLIEELSEKEEAEDEGAVREESVRGRKCERVEAASASELSRRWRIIQAL